MTTKTIKVRVEISAENVEACIASALANVTYGVGYWAEVAEGELGARALVRQREDGAGKLGRWLRLDDKAIKCGLALMASYAPRAFGNLLAGVYDAPLGDLLIQLSLLGEEKYG